MGPSQNRSLSQMAPFRIGSLVEIHSSLGREPAPPVFGAAGGTGKLGGYQPLIGAAIADKAVVSGVADGALQPGTDRLQLAHQVLNLILQLPDRFL